jgi:hypothetical protein
MLVIGERVLGVSSAAALMRKVLVALCREHVEMIWNV